MNMDKNEFQELLRKALQLRNQEQVSDDSSDDCLTINILEKLYHETLGQDERQAALKHIDRCHSCRADLANYFEIMTEQNAATELASCFSRLQTIRDCLPKISEILDQFDFNSVCHKLIHVCEGLTGSISLDEIDSMIAEVFLGLGRKIPHLCVQTRGQQDATASTVCSRADLEGLGRDIKSRIDKQLSAIEEPQPALWAGIPEQKVFVNLEEKMKLRAARIRDWCETRLEVLQQNPQLTALPSFGIGHSKHVLKYATDILGAFKNNFTEPFNWFAIYVCSYCHKLGIELSFHEKNTLTDKGLLECWESHAKLGYEFIMGDPQKSLRPFWQAMGFGSQQEAQLVAAIIESHQCSISEASRTMPAQSIFTDGVCRTITLPILRIIFNLANLLDSRPERVPALHFLKDKKIPYALVYEYLRNELTSSVEIDERCRICVKLKIRYNYPDIFKSAAETVKQHFQSEIELAGSTLKKYDIAIPAPYIDCSQSLFLEPHPYLTESSGV